MMQLNNLTTPDFLMADYLIEDTNRLFIVANKSKSLVEAIYLEDYFSLQIDSPHKFYEYVNTDGLTEKWLLAVHYTSLLTEIETNILLDECWAFYVNYLKDEDTIIDNSNKSKLN